jgi:hypothetical protein
MNASFINMNSTQRFIDGMSTRLTALRAAFSQRTIAVLDSKHFLQCGGCDYAAGQAGFKKD